MKRNTAWSFVNLLFALAAILVSASPASGQAQSILKNLEHEGQTRSYLLYVPAAYDGQADWPLVISFHGYSMSVDPTSVSSQPGVDGLRAVADTAGFLLAYPQGLTVETRLGTDVGWNFDGSFGAWDDVAFASRLIDHVDADYAVDLSRVHATGFSSGSMMAFTLACRLSDRIASVGGVSGPLAEKFFVEGCPDARSVSTLLVHGTADPIIPLSEADLTPSFWAQHNGCSVDSSVTPLPNVDPADQSTVTHIDYPDCKPGTEVSFYRVENGGHTWPGSTGQLPAFFGATNRDVHAASLIWDFFVQHPIGTAVEEGDRPARPRALLLHPNYPNPFNPATRIQYDLPTPAHVRLVVYNLLGQEVARLVEGRRAAGRHEVVWDASGAPGGVYLVRLTAGATEQTRHLMRHK